ncbi:lipopolysaccharide biosynthesis protein [Shewanella baltica]|uniref:lipopolysaccharide biosynthesis protein n=1 Tax=Shewanella TaxID=22 RepID=UPI003D7BB4DB
MNQLFKNIIIALSGNAFNAIINMFLIFYISRVYGLDFYGEFVIYQTTIMIAYVVTKINVWQSFVHKYYFFKNNSHVIKMHFGFDSFFSIISLVISFPIVAIIYDPVLALISSLYIVFYSNGFIVGLWRAKNKFNYYAIALNVCALLKLFVVFLIFFESAHEFVMFFFLCDILVWLSIWCGELILNKKNIFSKPLYYILLFNRALKNGKEVRFIFGCYLSSLIDLPVSQLDKLILALFVSPYYVGVYSLIRKVCQLISTVTEPVTHVLYSEYNKLLMLGRIKKVTLISKIFSFSIIFIGGILLLFVNGTFNYFNDEFLKNQLYEQKGLLLLGLAIQVIGLSFSWLNPLVLAIGAVKKSNYIALIANILYLGTLYFGTMFFGINAAFFALLLQYFIVAYLKYMVFYSYRKGLLI